VTHLALGWHEVIVSWSLDGVRLPACAGFLHQMNVNLLTLHYNYVDDLHFWWPTLQQADPSGHSHFYQPLYAS